MDGSQPANWNNTQIVVPSPNGSIDRSLVVTAGGMASNHVNFIVGTPPTISYTNPVRAAVGSSITIVVIFRLDCGNVSLTGRPAAPSSWSNTKSSCRSQMEHDRSPRCDRWRMASNSVTHRSPEHHQFVAAFRTIRCNL